MKNISIIISIAIVILLGSCNKNRNLDNPIDALKTSFEEVSNIADFYTFHNQMKDADISYLIQSYSGMYDLPEQDASIIRATIKGDNSPYTLDADSSTVIFTNYDYNTTSNRSSSYTSENMYKFYGDDYDLKVEQNTIKAKSDNIIVSPDASVYIPKLFYPVSFQSLDTEGRLISGTKILWETDNSNTHGVIIGIEYYPSTQSDSLNRVNYPKYMLKGLITEDDGEFTFSSADFADLPANADLEFYIIRTGFKSFTDSSGDDCTFAAIVSTGFGLRLAIKN